MVSAIYDQLVYAQAMASATAKTPVPSNVSEWVATPAPLNTEKYGERAIFSEDHSVVERLEPDNNPYGCVVYASAPLRLGQVWQITVLNIPGKWGEGLVREISIIII